ncbi:iqgap- protein [Massospora cicadina]|nr:iqgap- protein [Massospora cicadina]
MVISDSTPSHLADDAVVAGLLGRVRLQKHQPLDISNCGSIDQPTLGRLKRIDPSKVGLGAQADTERYDLTRYKKNWMEIERSQLLAYEYLCHVSEAKLWLEACLNADLGDLESLGVTLQNGVHLARLAKLVQPCIVKRIFSKERLQYRHSDNIYFFLEAAHASGLPKTFLFELTDLYSRKNIPKVIYCIHAFSHLLSKRGLAPGIQDLVGYLVFTDDQLNCTERELGSAKCKFPAFLNVGNDLSRAMEGTASIRFLGRASQRSANPESSAKRRSARTIGRHARGKGVRGKSITLISSHVATLTTITTSAVQSRESEVNDVTSSDLGAKKLKTGRSESLRSVDGGNHLTDSNTGAFHVRLASLQGHSTTNDRAHAFEPRYVVYSTPTPSPKLLLASFKELTKQKSRRRSPANQPANFRRVFPPDPLSLAGKGFAPPYRASKFRPMPSFQPPTLKLPALPEGPSQPSTIKLPPSPEGPVAGPVASPTPSPKPSYTESAESSGRWNKLKLASHEKFSKGINLNPSEQIIRGSNSECRSPSPFSEGTGTWEGAAHPLDGWVGPPTECPSGDVGETSDTETYIPNPGEEDARLSPHLETTSLREVDQPEGPISVCFKAALPPAPELKRVEDSEDGELAFEFKWENYEAFIIMAQSYVRGIQLRRRYLRSQTRVRAHEAEVVALQALARGSLARFGTSDLIHDLRAARDAVDVIRLRGLQAVARKLLARHRFIPRVIEARAQAEDYYDHLYRVQSLARRVLVQRKWTVCLARLQACREPVVAVQAMVRGFLVRQYYRECFVMPTPASTPELPYGCLPGRSYGNLIKFQEDYWANRERRQGPTGPAVRELPVATMKNLIHLLDDSDTDFAAELELAALRRRAVTKIREISQVERALDELDVKIALLVRNRISLGEVLRSARTGLGVVDQASDQAPPRGVALLNLDRENRRRLEGYQQLFYLLQTQPQYLARLLALMNHSGGRVAGLMAEPKRFFETVVLTLFGYGAREEYGLLRLFRTAIHQELEGIDRIEEFLRGNPVFIKLAVHYHRGVKERLYLRELLQPIIDAILDDPSIDLQTNPLLIYRGLIKQEESRTGERSRRPYDVTAEVALGDAETRTVLIRHLQQLRAITDQFIEGIYASLDRIPYGIRYIAKELKASLVRKFPAEREGVIVRIVGHLVYYRYISPAIVAPETFGVVERDISPNHRRCLAEVAKMLNQVTMGKMFSEDNVFLLPLNTYVAYTADKFARYVDAVADVSGPEAHFGADAQLELTALCRRPVIYISPLEIYSMHAHLADPGRRQLIAPDPEDPLAIVLDELGPPPTVPSDQLAANSHEISLQLVNRFPALNERDAELNRQVVETKRLIAHVLRVQSGASLLDILTKPSGPQEEARFEASISKAKGPRVPARGEVGRVQGGPYPSNPPVDIASLSFAQLKALALANARELETCGWLSSEDGYQRLLNALAADIRTKTKRRQMRSDELARTHLTLQALEGRIAYLGDQRRTYAEYLDACMHPPAFKWRKYTRVPFTKQYLHLKQLERRGEVPKFGSFRYTALKLYRRGILVSISEFAPTQFEQIHVTFASAHPGQFKVAATYLGARLFGSGAIITLEELLQAQFDNLPVLPLLGGGVRVNVNLLMHLINRKFYA